MSKTVGGSPTTALWMSTPQELRPAVESEAIRIAALTTGGLLTLYGIVRGGWLGFGAVVAGALTIRRSGALSRRPYASRWYVAEAAVTVLATPEQLHHYWTLLSMADTVSIIDEVLPGRPGEARLMLSTPDGSRLPWDVRVDVDLAGERMVWRSVPESVVPGEGEVWFVEAPGGRGTEVHARLRLGPPASLVGAIASGEIGDSGEPGASLADDLRRLKQRVEAGEVATTSGQPRGAGRRRLRRVAARSLPAPLQQADTLEESP